MRGGTTLWVVVVVRNLDEREQARKTAGNKVSELEETGMNRPWGGGFLGHLNNRREREEESQL